MYFNDTQTQPQLKGKGVVHAKKLKKKSIHLDLLKLVELRLIIKMHLIYLTLQTTMFVNVKKKSRKTSHIQLDNI